MGNELSCLVCGQIGTPAITHAPSGVYACRQCVDARQDAERIDWLYVTGSFEPFQSQVSALCGARLDGVPPKTFREAIDIVRSGGTDG
jgi:hypothetical protein